MRWLYIHHLGPRAGWNYARDGPFYTLQRYRQLTLDAIKKTIKLKRDHMPEVEIPKWVLNTTPFHKDVSDRLDSGGIHACTGDNAPPRIADFLAIMSAEQRAEYVDSRPTLAADQDLSRETEAAMPGYAQEQYNDMGTHPLELQGKASAESQT